MKRPLSELVELSRSLGSDIRLVWAGGGNISVKDDDGNMFIKASGTELGRMSRSRGWRKVNIGKVRHLLDNLLNEEVKAEQIKKGLLDTCCDGFPDAGMPSIETFFHTLLGRCVVHLHPMTVLPYLCSRHGQRRLHEILSPHYDFHWIGFRGLGVVTAGQILGEIRKKKLDLCNTHIFFLANHGLIVSCNSARQAKNTVHKIIHRCNRYLLPSRCVAAVSKRQIMETASRIQSACLNNGDFATARTVVPIRPLQTPNGLSPKKEWFNGVITPEELTYLGGGIVWLKDSRLQSLNKAIAGHFRKTSLWPKAFFIAGQGLFVLDKTENLSLYRKVFHGYLQVRGRAIRLGGLKPLARKYLSGEGL